MKQITIALVILATIFSACNNGTNSIPAKADKPSIAEASFGEYEGKKVTEYTLSNAAGMQVSIINYGGTLTKIIAPDKDGKPGNVILGYSSLDGYLQKGNPYFGALIGRYGNRIAHAKFSLDGKTYTLAANDHGNSLHGGNKGFDKVYWNIEKLPGDSSLKLTYTSKDGEEGYPGNLSITVVYTLSSDNALSIDYSATTDKATPVNLTSHAYFNLSAGADSTVLAHTLQINAVQYNEVDSLLIPTGKLLDVKGTPMDFNTAKPVGEDIASVKGGYDHNWILTRTGSGLEKVAVLAEPTSGRTMEVWTTEPGLQFYSGNFLDGTLQFTQDNKKYIQHGALCLEAQHYPDSPNEPSFPSTILEPGKEYHQLTVYKFSHR